MTDDELLGTGNVHRMKITNPGHFSRMEGDPLNPRPVFKREGMPKITLEMMKVDSSSMDFTIERQHHETGRTFSSEAFENYLMSITQFISTRLARHWETTGEPPQTMTVHIDTEIDTEGN